MVPDWKLERYLTGDLPDEEMRKIRNLEISDEVFAGRVRMFREDSRAILRKMPFETLSAQLEKVSSQANGRKLAGSNIIKFAVAAALVLSVVTVALFSQKEITPSGMEQGAGTDVAMLMDSGNSTRIKGMDSRMEAWKKTDGGIAKLEDMSDVREGDEIQLRYSVPQKCYGLLFSMDGNGAITMHMGDGDKAIALEPGKMVTLPYAYKLDDAPQFEKFFFLVSDTLFSIDVNNIDAVLKQKGVEVKSLTLRKVGEAQ
ncbi:MAG: hypothetical protein II892_14125 [Fibrobacter sp.]|nr:hypothetical protein [Fibrobacter sp.]